MAKLTKIEKNKKIVEKKVSKKVEDNKVSIFPTLGIIVALIIAAIFYYKDTSTILINTIEDKELLTIILGSIKIVSFNFIKFNVITLFLLLVLYWKKKYKILYVIVGGLILCNILSIDLNLFLASATSIIVGIYYIIKSLKKES